MNSKRLLALYLCVSICLFGCVQAPPHAPSKQVEAPEDLPLAPLDGVEQDIKLYRIHARDSLRITVFQEEDLSGPFKVNGDGAISYPFIGQVALEGLNVYEAEELLEVELKDGYLKHPDISIEVTEYHPFSVLGHVARAGNYEYREGMSVAEAIAVAGGFTDQITRQKFETLRKTDKGWQRFYTQMDDVVHPGDVIYVSGGGVNEQHFR